MLKSLNPIAVKNNIMMQQTFTYYTFLTYDEAVQFAADIKKEGYHTTSIEFTTSQYYVVKVSHS